MTLTKYISFLLLSSAVFVFSSTVVVQANEELDQDGSINNAFALGIIPQQAAKKISSLWSPLTKYIKQQTNYPIILHGSPDIPTYENRLFTGKFDFAYVNPRLFLEANKHVGYLPIVREGKKKLKGIIVVSKDSKYKSITDLMDVRFTSPKGAFAASALTRLNLQSFGVRVKNSYVDTHTQGYSLVVNGAVEAAGGVNRTFNSLNPKIKDKLRVLWTSKGVTPHAFIIHPRVNSKVKQRIVDAILSFKDTPEGVEFYKALSLNPFVAAESKDWDDVRQLMGL